MVITAAQLHSLPLLYLGYFLFGGATAAGYQARYAAVDLAPPEQRARHLSLIVWATTLGAVAGPNLAPVAGTTLAPYGVLTLAAPYAFSAGLLVLASLLVFTMLRPDPMVVAMRTSSPSGAETPARSRDAGNGMREALRVVLAVPAARLGVSAMAVGHLIMVAMMAMTPVHIRGAGHDAAHTLRIVGVVISAHIAGMFAFSPVMGWLTDRFGRRPVIGGGIALLLLACALAGSAGHNHGLLGVALMTLGLGWSATMVAGSTLLTESVPAELRASSQGLSDLIMGLAGASAGALSGVVVFAWGYAMLALLAALTTVPLMLLTARFEPIAARPGVSEV
jgi:MFS family permease